MSDDDVRPRRALAPDDSADQQPEAERLDENPFARPGSNAGSPTRARRSLPAEEPEAPALTVPGPVLPARGEGVYDGPGPVPRRSAMSSVTPPEAPEWVLESPASPDTTQSPAPVPSPTTDAEPPSDAASDTTVAPAHPDERPWHVAHLRGLIAAAVAVAVLALGAGVLGYNQAKPGTPTATPTPSASNSPSVNVPRVGQNDLITEADAKAASANADWAITGTTTSLNDHAARPACLSTEASDVDRIDSLQRTLGTTGKNKLAALHQLDAFPTKEAAQQVFSARAAALAQCNEVQTLILSATKVSGIAEDTMQISVVEEANPRKYHALLLTRTGNVLSIIDAASADGSVKPEQLVDMLKRSATQLCQKAGNCDPASATVEDATVPAVDPKGWLIPSDLPRIRAGAGLWTAQPPADISSKGTGCENLNLASESGPTKRQQATYLVAQDDKAPEQFGLDEFVFRFNDEKSAAQFASKLGKGIAGCKERVLGTKISSINGPKDAQAFTIERETSNGNILYQVALAQRGKAVVYLMANVTKDFQFSEQNLGSVITRAGVRVQQGE